METDDLREHLTSVHRLLTGSPDLDAESRDLLRTVLTDIEVQLRRAPERGLAGSTEGIDPRLAPPPATPRLERLAVRFEAGHPAIAGALRQLTDLLAKAGI